MTPLTPPARDPRQTRHSMRVVARAKELVEAGWTTGETRKLLAQEFSLARLPSATTIRSWTEPGYRELHRTWQLKCSQNRVAAPAPPPSALTPDLLLSLRVEDGLSYSAIAAVVRRFFGEDLTENQVRYRLTERLGAPKNAAKAAAMKRQWQEATA